MAAGSPFTMKVNSVEIMEPAYHNVITTSESMKKEYMNVSSAAIQRFKLSLQLVTSEKDTLLAHFNDQYGGYHSFSWTSVPSHINSGVSMTGRWVDGSLSLPIRAGLVWLCQVEFEKEN